MPTDSAGTGFSPQLRRLYEINKIRDRFEAELKSGNQPQIESYLAQWTEDGSAEIFVELLALELHYRGHRGERPILGEYHLRFPQYVQEIAREFPAEVGDYELIQLLGVGAFANVYHGRKKGTNVERAVKVFSRRESSSDTLQRVRSEFEVLSKLKHRAIVTGHDVACTPDGVVYLVMEYVEGESLEEKLKGRNKLEVFEAVKIILEVADALAYAHQTMLHRDLKPSNILLGRDGQTYVVDFGLALPHDERYERRGERAGTYAYMSPEQVTGQTVNGRTDIWSAGVILYQMLTGVHPFSGKNQQELFDQIRNLEPIPPRQRRDDIAEELESICLRCLEKEEGRRFGTASDLGAALRKLQEKPSAPSKPPAPRTRADAVKRWVRSWMAVPAAVLVIVGAWFTIWHKSDADIAKEIERRFQANPAALSWVTVHVNGGVATLGGTVSNASDKDNAGSIAAGVSGKKCINKIEVAGQTKVNSKDGLTYVWIPPGTFKMGCSPGDNECGDYEKPAHSVTITKGFWMGQTPVTQAAYLRVMVGRNPSSFHGDQLPVERVTWDEANSYCTVLGMRLPTEAEWEYAARAGSTASHYGDIDAIAWYGDNSGKTRIDSKAWWQKDWRNVENKLKANGGQTHPVGLKQPNAWKLYDMLGNVWQWTADWYDDYYYGPSPLQDPRGPSSGTDRVLRGAVWGLTADGVRVSSRYGFKPGVRIEGSGFRCGGESLP